MFRTPRIDRTPLTILTNFENSADSNEIIAYAPISLYSKDSIFKCVYWYGDKYNVKVSLIEDSAFQISLRPLNAEEFAQFAYYS